MTKLIDKLKQNTLTFEELSDEERDCFKELGVKNCQEKLWRDMNLYSGSFSPGGIYRIKWDYQPKPERFFFEIRDGQCKCNICGKYFTAAELTSWAHFRGFFVIKDDSKPYSCSLEAIASLAQDGYQVYAEFSKE